MTTASIDRIIEIITAKVKPLFDTGQEASSVVFFELGQDFYELYQKVTTIPDSGKENQSLIERILTDKLISPKIHQTIRLGLINTDLFLWCRNTNPDNWLNIFARETFYFQSLNFKKRLIDKVRQQLELKSDRILGRLIGQITDFSYKIPNLVVISDFIRSHPRMQGETLHFLLNATNQDLHDIKGQISHIGKGHQSRGRILNPKFPQIEPLRTQLLASMICDGHLNRRRCLHYTEKDLVRLRIIKSYFNELGDVEFSERIHSNGCTRLNLPAVIGRLLELWGMPVGDKAILDIGLPNTILEANQELKRIYLQELIPEEGSFIPRDGCFRWSRTSVLDAGTKSQQYSFTPKISQKHLNIISKFGSHAQRFFGRNQSRKVIRLIWGRLRAISDSDRSSFTNDAKLLLKVVLANPPKLMEDEVDLCKSLEIEISYNPVVINLFETGRVSVTWHATTATTIDGIRWALQAPPHDKRKRIEVENFLATIQHE